MQTKKRTGGGGRIRQCTERATCTATEPMRSDGQAQGTVALCEECAAVCREQMPGATFRTLGARSTRTCEADRNLVDRALAQRNPDSAAAP
jgi:hypothetical protein